MTHPKSQWWLCRLRLRVRMAFAMHRMQVRMEKVNPQLAQAQHAKAEPPDSIMKDVKSELGAFLTLCTKVEALITSKWKPDDRKDHAMASMAHAVFACKTGRLSQVLYSHPAHRQHRATHVEWTTVSQDKIRGNYGSGAAPALPICPTHSMELPGLLQY